PFPRRRFAVRRVGAIGESYLVTVRDPRSLRPGSSAPAAPISGVCGTGDASSNYGAARRSPGELCSIGGGGSLFTGWIDDRASSPFFGRRLGVSPAAGPTPRLLSFRPGKPARVDVASPGGDQREERPAP